MDFLAALGVGVLLQFPDPQLMPPGGGRRYNGRGDLPPARLHTSP